MKKIIIFSLVLFFILGAASANDLNSTDTTVTSDVKEIYVNTTGDDLNTGSSDSPYATIKKAVNNITESDKATVYLSKGTFSSDDDADFEIDMNHKVYGGNIKFIGAGTDETFIDGQSSFRFASLGLNTNITFKDLTFINFKSNNGGTLFSEGILNIDNCVFKDSYASDTRGGAIFSLGENTGELYVTNSMFISCSVNGNPQWNSENHGGGAICTDNIKYAYLENNTFINTTVKNDFKGFAVNIHSSRDDEGNYYINTKSYIKANRFINITANSKSVDAGVYVSTNTHNDTYILNNEFINCYNPSEEYSVVYLRNGKTVFENNAFVNSTNDAGNIFLESQTTLNTIKINLAGDLSVITPYEINNGITLELNITDDMGNIVKTYGDAARKLISDNCNYTDSSYIRRGNIFYFGFANIPNPGNYSFILTLRGSDYYLTDLSIVYDSSPSELWVSPNGFDGNNGTEENPFKSIEYAVNIGFNRSYNVVIHLLKGTYNGEGNVELFVTNKGSLQIIGEEYGKCIIDGENSHWFVRSFTNTTITNVSFINGYSKNNHLITTRYGSGATTVGGSLFLENCIVDSCRCEDYNIIDGVPFYNLTYTNNVGKIYASNIVNSHFENNTNPEVFEELNNNPTNFGGIIRCPRDGLTIVNSSFINNSAEYGGVFWISTYSVISFNSYYANNHAVDGGVFYIFGVNSDCKFSSYNDTFTNNSAVRNGVVGFRTEQLGIGSSPDPKLPTFEIANGTFIGNHAQRAGVLVMQKGTIVNSSFINNSADYGGAIVVVPTNKRGAQLNMINFENLTFRDNYAGVNGGDIYLTTDVDSTWYKNQNLYFALPLNITFNNLTTDSLLDYVTADIRGPCGTIIGGSRVNFKMDNEIIGHSGVVNGKASLKYYGFENGEFILSGDIDNIYKCTVNDGVIRVNLTNYVSETREVWVSTKGSDSDGDGTKNNPYKTIEYAINESSANCLNVVVHLEGGIYAGEFNTRLEVSSVINLTLKGENGTVIDGENTNWLIKVLQGKNRITISDLTIKDMLVQDKDASSITVDEGANLCLDNVLITGNWGGEAIIRNDGNLVITNSIITKNGFSTIALVCGGNVKIYNTSMTDSFGVSASFDCKHLTITNSLIRNSYNLGAFSLIKGGDCILENTVIINDGNASSINMLDSDRVNVFLSGWSYDVMSLLVPALSLESNVYMKNVSVINNYKSPINLEEKVTVDYQFLSIMGYYQSGRDGKNFTAVDCSFYNFRYIWTLNEWGDLNFTFERCIFKNITQICKLRAVGQNSRWVFNDCIFLDVDPYFQRPSYFGVANPTQVSHNNGINNIPYENNFWASNSKPVIRYADGDQLIFNYYPTNWIVLNRVNGILKLQSTNGRTVKDYNGDLPLKLAYALSDGEFVPAIVVDGNAYSVIFEGEYIKVSSVPLENPLLKDVADNTLFTGDLTLRYGEDLNFTGELLYPWGDPLANTNVTFKIDGKNFTATTDENGIVNLNVSLNAGVYDVITINPSSKQMNINTIVVSKSNPTITVANVNSVYNDGKYLVVNVNAPGNVTVSLNGKNITKAVDSNGQVKIPITLSPKTYAAAITYHGNVNYLTASASATVKVSKATPKMTAKKATFKVKTKTKKYGIVLKDNKNKAMKKTKVTLKVKGKTYKATTNAKGKATFKIKNLKKKGKYTAKVKFAGNKNFKAVTKSVKIAVKK